MNSARVSYASNSRSFQRSGTHHGTQTFGRMHPTILHIEQQDEQPKKALNAPNIGLTGLDQLCSSGSKIPTKILWIAVYVICTIVCLVQLNDRVKLYLQHPVSVSMLITRFKELEYPVIVFCYTDPPFRRNISAYLRRISWTPPCKYHTDKCKSQKITFNTTLKYSVKDVKYFSSWKEAKKLNKTFNQYHKELIRENIRIVEHTCSNMSYWCTDERQKPYRDYFKSRNTTLQYIWTETNIPDRYISLEDPDCNVKNVKDCVTLSTIYSIAGSCHVVRKDKPFFYKGDKTILRITFNDLKNRQYDRISFGVYFQSNGPINLNCILTTVVSIRPGINTNARLVMKKFLVENSTERPCWDLKSASDCVNNCFLNTLGMFLNCRLPSMDQVYHLEECPSWHNLSAAIKEALDVYNFFDSTKCLCPKPCEDNVYSVLNWETQNSRSISDMNFTLSFGDNLIEVITESLSYKLSALISDIGGNLGIFLGVSILTFVEILDELLKRCWRSFFCMQERLTHHQ